MFTIHNIATANFARPKTHISIDQCRLIFVALIFFGFGVGIYNTYANFDAIINCLSFSGTATANDYVNTFIAVAGLPIMSLTVFGITSYEATFTEYNCDRMTSIKVEYRSLFPVKYTVIKN